jgi:hypothetical protein
MNSTSFLRRWSQRKLEGAVRSAPATGVKQAAVPLPAPETLDFDADFSMFMQEGVDGEVRRNALRKLFMTDHYRVMDGLDVYVDDYSRPTLLPSDLLQTLDHAQTLLKKTEESIPDAAVDAAPDHPESV